MIFEFPVQAKVGMTVAKEKIYGKAGVKSSLRDKFVKEVEKIAWLYKLAPETINIAETKNIREIQIFSIELRIDELNDDVLRCLDTAIPHPILFQLRRDGKVRTVAAMKRINEADESKRVLSGYFRSDWFPEDTPKQALPFANNLETLYSLLLQPLIPYPARPGETLRDHVQRSENAAAKKKEMDRLNSRINREPQFNRKAAMNKEYHKLKKELNELISQ